MPRARQRRVDFLVGSYVELNRGCAHAVLASELRGELLQAVAAARCQRDVGARHRERRRTIDA